MPIKRTCWPHMGVGTELAKNLMRSGVRQICELAANALRSLDDQKQGFSSPLNKVIPRSYNSIWILPLLESHIS